LTRGHEFKRRTARPDDAHRNAVANSAAVELRSVRRNRDEAAAGAESGEKRRRVEALSGVDPGRWLGEFGGWEETFALAPQFVGVAAAEGDDAATVGNLLFPEGDADGVEAVPGAVPDFDGVVGVDALVFPIGAPGAGVVDADESAGGDG